MAGSNFVSEFIKNRKMVGALTPSGPALVKQLIVPHSFKGKKCIVELGPGNGCVTKKILQKMDSDAILLSFELNDKFVQFLRKIPDPRLHVIHDTAENIGKYIQEAGFEKADVIISSLPLTNIPGKIKINIINESVKYLSADGIFTQFQYYKTAEKLLRKKFKNVRIKIVPLNIPPAFVYICNN